MEDVGEDALISETADVMSASIAAGALKYCLCVTEISADWADPALGMTGSVECPRSS